MRTRNERLRDRADLYGGDDSAALVVELCMTIDDMGERIVEKLDELHNIVDLLNALDERLWRESHA